MESTQYGVVASHRAARASQYSMAFALAASAIAGWFGPMAGDDAALLQIPTLVAAALLVRAAQLGWLSMPAFCCATAFLALHSIASYYGYCNVPYDDWLEATLGVRIDRYMHSSRNHFDRLIHFGYGLLLFAPVRQVVSRAVRVPWRWSAWIAVDFILATSLLYEIVEWLIAVFMAPQIAESYNGQQGDPWDAQKDMALAVCGAVLAALFCGGRRWLAKTSNAGSTA